MIFGRDDWRTFKQRPEVVLLDSARAGREGLGFAGLGHLASDGGGHPLMLDSGPYENHSTLTGGPTWQWSNELGRWRVNTLAASSQYIQLPSSFAIGKTDRTISFWLNPVSVASGAICGNDSAAATSDGLIWWVSSGTLKVRVGGSTTIETTCSETFVAGTDYHVSCVFQTGSPISVYVNGQAKNGTQTGTFTAANVPVSPDTWQIASRGNGSLFSSSGISDFLIHSRAISLDEIETFADPDPMLDGLILSPAMFPATAAATGYPVLTTHQGMMM